MATSGRQPAGTRLGPWTVESALGRGGMGVVYRARDDAGREAAIKVLASDLARDRRTVERFHREALTARSIAHRNVVACLGSGSERGLEWMALELVTGGSLADKVAHGPLPWRDAARAGAEIARALEALHAAGILHRDLKPANVLLDAQGHAKVGDFGLARSHLASMGGLTATGELVGTAEYMAPEQAEGGSVVDERADLYSLGCTLYCLLAGEPPFRGSGAEVIAKHVTAKPRRVRSVARDVPGALDALVARLLEKNPADRATVAGEVAAELERIARSRPDASRRVAAALAAVALAAGGAWLATRERTRTPALARPSPTVEPVRATPSPSLAPSPSPTPGWFLALPPEKRPPAIPLSLEVGPTPGEYLCRRDRSLVLLYVPGGKCRIGAAPAEAVEEQESPPHDVELSPYFVGKLEVSNRQFAAFVKATGFRTHAEEIAAQKLSKTLAPVPDDGAGGAWSWHGPHSPTVAQKSAGRFELEFTCVPGATWLDPSGQGPRPAGDLPVVQVTWEDASAYAAWAGVRLPTNAEWERAASWDGAAARLYPWGNDEADFARANYFNLDGGSSLVPVDDPRNKSPVGALGMAGNAREWVADSYEQAFYETPEASALDAMDGSGPPYTTKGGSYKEAATRLRCSGRWIAYGSDDMTGFRVGVSADGSPRPKEKR